jgi:hypothetical protein
VATDRRLLSRLAEQPKVRRPGETQGVQIVCTLKELSSKVVPQGKTLDQLIEAARFSRGRRASNGR